MGNPGENSNTGETFNLSEKSCSWKSKLSGAYNDEQVFFSLLLLGIFYVGYTAAKADFDADNTSIDNEERFIQSCYCSTHQRSFFRSWFLLFCVIWLLIHSYTFLTPVFAKLWPGWENIITGLLTFGSVFSEFTCLYPCMKCDIGNPDNNHNQLKVPKLPKMELERNIRLLWYQYCKLYVVGYAQDDEMVTFTSNNEKQKGKKQTDNKGKRCCFLECTCQSSQYAQDDEMVKFNDEKQKNGNQTGNKKKGCCFLECTCQSSQYAQDDEMVKFNDEKQKNGNQTGNKKKGCCFLECTCQSSQQKDDCVCCKKYITCPTINIQCCNHYFPRAHILKGIIRGFLFLVKYVSQLVTVPLLLLQIFDTYSLLCFSPDLYCSRTSEYKLHLAQATITLLFYCSLALSQLVSTMLAWNPWPQTNKQTINRKPDKSTQTDESILVLN